MDLELRGKKVLVTGASKGIGLACAHGLAAEGARVHIASRSEAGLKAAAGEIARQHKAEVSIHPFDLGKTQNVLALAKDCSDVDVLVNNAGAIPSGSLSEVDDATWRHAWELKVLGYINLARELYRRMGERGSGVIVNVIGVAVAGDTGEGRGGRADAAHGQAVAGSGPRRLPRLRPRLAHQRHHRHYRQRQFGASGRVSII